MTIANFGYFSILFFTILFPFIFSFEKSIQYFKNWKYVFYAFLIVGIPFIIWDSIFNANKIWEFNEDFVIGADIFGLPIEEVLFFICIPFSTLFFYELSTKLIKNDTSNPKHLTVYKVLALTSIPGLYFLFQDTPPIYTTSIFIVTGIVSSLITITKQKFATSYRFYTYFGLSLIGFLLVNTVLTGLPVVTYNNNHILNLRIGTIPIEDFLYFFSMSTLYIYVYLRLKKSENVV